MANKEIGQQPLDCELAALYALDALEEEEQRDAEAYFADCPEFAQEVEEFQEAIAAFSYSASPEPMAANLKDRLFQRITNDTYQQDTQTRPLITASVAELKEQAANLSWEAIANVVGFMMATLRVDEEEDKAYFFVKAETKAAFPKHWHTADEEILILEGDVVVDEQVYRSGDRIRSYAGTAHQPETRGGCLIFCISSLNDAPLPAKAL